MSKVVVVTGAAGGIGSATCELLRAEGWVVVGLDVRPADGVRTVDLADASQLDECVRDLVAQHATVHGLVNNAAVQDLTPIADLDGDRLASVLTANVGVAHGLTRGLTSALQRGSGAVVNVSSVHAVASTPQMAAYASSKAALVAYTRVAALELAPDVRVNAVLPGAVDTPMLRSGLSRRPEDGDPTIALSALADRTPLRRVGQPVEIASVIAFLLDNSRSGFVTGATLVADGGVTARLPSE